MPILNSTKSGKHAIPLTTQYLLDHHWNYRRNNDATDIDRYHIWKNKNHCLSLDDEAAISIFLEFETIDYDYRFDVKTIADLDLVELFWKKTQSCIHEDAIKVLEQNQANLHRTENTKWTMASDYFITSFPSKDYDKDYESIDSYYQPWKLKNKKNYFASYFK